MIRSHLADSSLVISRVRYCISVFDNGTHVNNIRLRKIINYAVKVILGRRKICPCLRFIRGICLAVGGRAVEVPTTRWHLYTRRDVFRAARGTGPGIRACRLYVGAYHQQRWPTLRYGIIFP